MIKQTFLDSLESLPIDIAEAKVRAAGHIPYTVPEEAMAITLEAKPNTVVLWQEGGLVSIAQAGDGLELDEDA